MTPPAEPGACPNEDDLDRYHAQELPDDRLAQIRTHLAACAACFTRDSRLVSAHDTWISQIRQAGPPPRDRLEGLGSHTRSGEAAPGYTMLEELSRGAQGVVFKAVQNSTRRTVALKILREGVLASAATRRRFEREVEIVARLNHPHIVAVYDSGVTAAGQHYLAMEYVEGVWLSDWTPAASARHSAQRRFSREAMRPLLSAFAKVCDAVNYAHQRGVIHRDLKPSNILMDKAGEPHILDFGLARPLEADATRLTLEGGIAGTLAYMSPEQASGASDSIDIRSDVYSLGMMLHEMLTGTFPYPVEGETVTVLRHIAETPPAWPKAMDAELRTILLKAISKSRERRYQTAGDLARDLERYSKGEPIEARRDSTWYVVRKSLARHRVAVGVTAGFVMLVTASAVALAGMYVRQTRLRDQAERRLTQVREIARSFIFDFDPRIRHLPGTLDARRLLVEKGLDYLDAIARELPGELEVQREVAAAYLSIGDVQADISDHPGALHSYRTALSMFEAVASRQPDDLRTERTLVLCNLKLGDLLWTTGDRTGSHAMTEAGLARARRVAAAYPGDRLAVDGLAHALERMGNVFLDAGQIDEAEKLYREMIDVSSVSPIPSGSPPAGRGALPERDTGVAWVKLAQIHYNRGRKAEALALYREFLALSEALLAARPEYLVARRDVAAAYQWIGILLQETGDPKAALDPLLKSAAMLDELMRDDPQNDDRPAMMSTTLTRLGEVQLALSLHNDALGTFTRNVELAASRAARFPDRPEVLRQKGVALYKLAEYYRSLAQDAATPAEQSGPHWRAVRNYLTQALDVFLYMRRERLLPPADQGVPAELQAEIEQLPAAGS